MDKGVALFNKLGSPDQISSDAQPKEKGGEHEKPENYGKLESLLQNASTLAEKVLNRTVKQLVHDQLGFNGTMTETETENVMMISNATPTDEKS